MELTLTDKALERISKLYALSAKEISMLVDQWGLSDLISNDFIDADNLNSTYRHKIAAFVVLSHAVIENYIEELCCYLIEYSLHRYRKEGNVNRTLLMFSLHHPVITHKFDDSQWEDQEPIAQDQLIKAVKKFTREIRDNNHGIKYKYLNKIIRPVGLDLNDAARARIALQTLGELRGSVAHRFLDKESLRPVRTFENPDQVYSIVIRSLKVARHLRNKSYIMIANDSSMPLRNALNREFISVILKYKEKKERLYF